MLQEYLLALGDNMSSAVSFTWMMNNELDMGEGGKWRMVPTAIRTPSELPEGLRSYGSAWEVTGAPQPLLKSGVKEGIFLTVKQLELIHSKLGFSVPEKGQGSGKNGAIIKIDLAQALVESLWGEDTPEEKKRMVDQICGKIMTKVKCAKDVILAVKELGAQGEQDFADIHQVALNQECVERERKLRSPTEDREDIKTFTPGVLKDFLPNVQGVICNRNPILSRYQAFYPGSWSLTQNRVVIAMVSYFFSYLNNQINMIPKY